MLKQKKEKTKKKKINKKFKSQMQEIKRIIILRKEI